MTKHNNVVTLFNESDHMAAAMERILIMASHSIGVANESIHGLVEIDSMLSFNTEPIGEWIFTIIKDESSFFSFGIEYVEVVWGVFNADDELVSVDFLFKPGMEVEFTPLSESVEEDFDYCLNGLIIQHPSRKSQPELIVNGHEVDAGKYLLDEVDYMINSEIVEKFYDGVVEQYHKERQQQQS